ncbi:MAG TPA: thioredoxin family protein [Chryseosolibacter sp.]|nr:thioredoxin family protein [Chryseosolibacter sp.]
MAATPSIMTPLGTAATHFKLQDTISGKSFSLEELKGRVATVLMFICNHCPYVKLINPELVRIARDFAPQGIAFVAISSNDVEQYPDDSPEKMKETAKNLGYPFPYLFDETQEVAKAYDAACTPDFFVFDSDLKLQYRGQFDDARPGNSVVPTGRDLAAALQALAKGQLPSPEQRPSIGCNIKWKK